MKKIALVGVLIVLLMPLVFAQKNGDGSSPRRAIVIVGCPNNIIDYENVELREMFEPRHLRYTIISRSQKTIAHPLYGDEQGHRGGIVYDMIRLKVIDTQEIKIIYFDITTGTRDSYCQ